MNLFVINQLTNDVHIHLEPNIRMNDNHRTTMIM